MLFVNEEFELSQPLFSEPTKVHPQTDDEMARRIKSMLGEYVHHDEPKKLFKNENISRPKDILNTKSMEHKNLKDDIQLKNLDDDHLEKMKNDAHLENIKNGVHIENLKNDVHIENLKHEVHIENLKHDVHLENIKHDVHLENLKNGVNIENIRHEVCNENADSIVHLSYSQNNDIKDKIVKIPTNKNEVMPETKDTNNSETTTDVPDTNYRRSSLKRQCKEKISLLDYNPMFTIRTKRSKPLSNSHKSKSQDSYEGKKNSSLESSLKDLNKHIEHELANLNDSMCGSNVGDELPTLKKYPDMHSQDRFTKVPDLESPPLLDPMNATSTGCNNKSPLNIVDVKETSSYKSSQHSAFFDRQYLNEYLDNGYFKSQTKSAKHFNSKIKNKKQSKKKKIANKSNSIKDSSMKNFKLASNARNENFSNSKIGSCQLKNGIIKIKLSKLPDNKKENADKDYEVSHCETDAIIGCKTLSVPLSPLEPDVYSDYFTSYKIKRKSHSSKNKKKDKRNGLVNSIKNDPSLENFSNDSKSLIQVHDT